MFRFQVLISGFEFMIKNSGFRLQDVHFKLGLQVLISGFESQALYPNFIIPVFDFKIRGQV